MPQKAFLDREIIGRFVASEAAYCASRMAAIQEQVGNPFGVEIEEDGPLRILLSRAMPRSNGIVGLNASSWDRVAALCKSHSSLGVPLRVEIPPTDLDETLARSMARAGLYQSGFHATLYKRLGTVLPARPNDPVEIEEVADAKGHEMFMEAYLEAWEMPEPFREGAKENLRRWMGRPGWRLYLALVEGQPAATAISFTTDDTTYLASGATLEPFRNKGCHAALLEQRIRDAIEERSNWIFGKADYLSTSYRNLERAGLESGYNSAVWSPLPR